ncbi:MAG: NAD(P)-dependent oxidoreductase [bacterium]|nr:NAD(P)-dependent oxidoreductase [bacterium]
MAKKVGFVGLGTMGSAMTNNLLKAGYEVQGFDPFPAAREKAEKAGVRIVGSPAEAARGAEVLCSSVPETEDVHAAYLGEKGVLAGAAKGLVCFDFSTISPEGSAAVAAEAAKGGVIFCDTPVGGSEPTAIAGQLAIMVGGDKAAMEKHRDVLEVIGASARHIGPNGYGLRMKLISNHLVSGMLCLFAEALTLGQKSGLAPEAILDYVLDSSIPPLFKIKGPTMVAKDYTPTFRVDLMKKDLRLIAAMAEAARAPVPLSSFVRQVYTGASAMGFGAQDQNAVYEYFLRAAGD